MKRFSRPKLKVLWALEWFDGDEKIEIFQDRELFAAREYSDSLRRGGFAPTLSRGTTRFGWFLKMGEPF